MIQFRPQCLQAGALYLGVILRVLIRSLFGRWRCELHPPTICNVLLRQRQLKQKKGVKKTFFKRFFVIFAPQRKAVSNNRALSWRNFLLLKPLPLSRWIQPRHLKRRAWSIGNRSACCKGRFSCVTIIRPRLRMQAARLWRRLTS